MATRVENREYERGEDKTVGRKWTSKVRVDAWRARLGRRHVVGDDRF